MKDETQRYCWECERTHAGPYVDREGIYHIPEGWLDSEYHTTP